MKPRFSYTGTIPNIMFWYNFHRLLYTMETNFYIFQGKDAFS